MMIGFMMTLFLYLGFEVGHFYLHLITLTLTGLVLVLNHGIVGSSLYNELTRVLASRAQDSCVFSSEVKEDCY